MSPATKHDIPKAAARTRRVWAVSVAGAVLSALALLLWLYWPEPQPAERPEGPSDVVAVRTFEDRYEIVFDAPVMSLAVSEWELRRRGLDVRLVAVTATPGGVGEVLGASGRGGLVDRGEGRRMGQQQQVVTLSRTSRDVHLRVGVPAPPGEPAESVVWENLLMTDPRFGCGRLLWAPAREVIAEAHRLGFDVSRVTYRREPVGGPDGYLAWGLMRWTPTEVELAVAKERNGYHETPIEPSCDG